MSHYHQLFIQVCHNYGSCITRSLVLIAGLTEGLEAESGILRFLCVGPYGFKPRLGTTSPLRKISRDGNGTTHPSLDRRNCPPRLVGCSIASGWKKQRTKTGSLRLFFRKPRIYMGLESCCFLEHALPSSRQTAREAKCLFLLRAR